MVICLSCKASNIPEDATNCPKCGAPLGTSSPTIQSIINIDTNKGGNVTGVIVEHMGYSAAEVQAILDKIRKEYTPLPFSGECPYRGLEPFEEEDAWIFFGREKLVEEIVQRLKSIPFSFITGPSGSGKSSLVRAGVLPTLKRSAQMGSTNWLYATLIPGRTPIDSLGRTLSTLAGNLNPLKDFHSNGKSDPSLLSQWSDILLGERRKRRLVIFIDQFEEVFTNLSDKEEEQRLAFIRQITRAANATEGRVTLLITIRSDFLSDCAAYPELNSLVNRGFLQIGTMSPDELVSSIVRPAMQVGLSIQPALAYQIVLDMRDQPGALPLMQFALKDLFEAQIVQEKGDSLTLDAYLSRGGLGEALQRYADSVFTHLSPFEQELARVLFRALVVPGRRAQDTSRTALFRELTPSGTNAQQLEAVVNKLVQARLITIGQSTNMKQGNGDNSERTVTLAHERLLEVWPWLRHLIDEDRSLIVLKNEIEEDARRWEDNSCDFSYLYSGTHLKTVQERLKRESLSLSDLASSFVRAGVEHEEGLLRDAVERDKAERRKNWLRTIAVVVGIIVIFLAGSVVYRRWLMSQAIQIGPSIHFSEAIATLGDDHSDLLFVSPSLHVRLPSFNMDVHEVTNAQYCLCRRADGCNSDPSYNNISVCDPMIAQIPVSDVTLDQAEQYCRWLGRRLPTEIEWEWAARGQSNRIYPTGDNRPVSGQVNIWDEKSIGGEKWPVDRVYSDITPDKLLDMAGNVREWTLSLWLSYNDPNYLKSYWPDMNVAADGFYIARGGSFKTGPDSARSISRYRVSPDDQLSDLGFRCVEGLSIQAFIKEVYVLP